ncbi:1-phosphofructokinase family hexose kinase [Zhihengliuella flava]|uniref:1-phosphofructokinase n=1 Tax=Zhihengliuella flava TaxID=1285193 RepID=A0A931D4N9_9MICC|nr:1-phosphofructokinase family hexose kinase [Zhihengliuella flava]MBG6084359.1 1-phosphofructokinase [Zhihengliuella flava]
MIVTLTANPSLDRTIELDAPLSRGGVQRAVSTSAQAAGKGVNVSRAIATAGADTLAVLPGDARDPLITALTADGLPHRALPIGAGLRSNITLTEPDGTTTKINEPGPHLDAEAQEALTRLVTTASDGASWLVLAGSLPPGVGAEFYARLTAALRTRLGARCPRIALDTSGAPLTAVLRLAETDGPAVVPSLLKPNAEELAEIVPGTSEAELEADPARAAAAAARLIEAGAEAVLATLGAAGALLITADGAWHATHAPVTARSTVGAGDSSLAGFLLAHAAGAAHPDCLRRAVAYGAAAVSLPGSTIPSPTHTTEDAVSVTDLTTKD